VELAGPLTAYEVLKALGEAQLFECVRNHVLTLWLERHKPDEEEELETWPVYSFPLMPAWAKLYEARKFPKYVELQADMFRTLEPPAEFDPTANKSLDELADLVGGRAEAIMYINCGGATTFEGLTPGPPKGRAAGDASTAEGSGANDWTMNWSDPFA
jgi:hypothetical protein